MANVLVVESSNFSQLTETRQVDELETVAQTGSADVPSLNGPRGLTMSWFGEALDPNQSFSIV